MSVAHPPPTRSKPDSLSPTSKAVGVVEPEGPALPVGERSTRLTHKRSRPSSGSSTSCRAATANLAIDPRRPVFVAVSE
jgi:hypothetical protein